MLTLLNYSSLQNKGQTKGQAKGQAKGQTEGKHGANGGQQTSNDKEFKEFKEEISNNYSLSPQLGEEEYIPECNRIKNSIKM